MSTPASSCSFTASMVASRLARASSEPSDFQGAHSVLGSASHSGFGSEPAIVVGNSMSAYPRGFLIGWSICHVRGRRYRTTRFVVPGLVPGIHVFLTTDAVKTWMAGTKPGHDDEETSIGAKSILGWTKQHWLTSHDRPSLCADAEWLENLDHAGGNRPSLFGVSDRHPGRRPVQAGFPGDQSEQSDSGHRGSCAPRWRRAVFGVRDRRDPDLSRRQDRAFYP